MKRSLKILHVIRSLSPENGGPMEGIRRLAQIARQQSYELEAVSLDPPDAPFLKHLPFAAHALGPALGRYGYSPRLMPWMRANAHRFDGVVINGLWQYHGFGTWRVLAGKVPFVVFTHGMLDPYFKKRYPLKHAKKWIYWALFEFWMLRRANAVLFTSPLEKVLAEESFWLRQWNPVVVPYGTTGPDFDIEESIYSFHEAHPQLRDKRFILYLSRIDPKKGCDLLIDAFAKVAASDPSLHLVIAGPDLGNLVPKLQQQAQERGIANRILWPGMLRDAIKWGAFYTSEVYILPSHQENFGIAVSEAMACGKAVLTTDKVNIWPDILESGSGYIESDTVEGIENLLRRWIKTPQEERDAMGQRALVTFGERFNMRRTATSILKELGHSLPEAASIAVPEVSR
jgi:glycosyltransferase involved in cell wall biosynthesis